MPPSPRLIAPVPQEYDEPKPGLVHSLYLQADVQKR